jgi:CyaY protein
MSLPEDEFDRAADAELHALEASLSRLDPDEVEVDLASGVLTLELADGQKVVVNSHRAAGQIWMAAFRSAWHFSPHREGDVIRWRTERDELRATLARVLSERLAKTISL